MKTKYYVNSKPQANGDHEVHAEGCHYMPSIPNKQYLGEFSSCEEAVIAAKKQHSQSNGCYFCSYPCHTS